MIERILRDIIDIVLGILIIRFGMTYSKQKHQALKKVKYTPYWIIKSALISFGILGIIIVIWGFYMEPF